MKVRVVSKSTTVNRFVLLILQRNITRYFERGGGGEHIRILYLVTDTVKEIRFFNSL